MSAAPRACRTGARGAGKASGDRVPPRRPAAAPGPRPPPARASCPPYALLVPLVAQPLPGRRLAQLVRRVAVRRAELRQPHRRPQRGLRALEQRGLLRVALPSCDQRRAPGAPAPGAGGRPPARHTRPPSARTRPGRAGVDGPRGGRAAPRAVAAGCGRSVPGPPRPHGRRTPGRAPAPAPHARHCRATRRPAPHGPPAATCRLRPGRSASQGARHRVPAPARRVRRTAPRTRRAPRGGCRTRCRRRAGDLTWNTERTEQYSDRTIASRNSTGQGR